MHFLSRVTKRVVAALVCAAMICTLLTSLGYVNTASAAAPANDAVTELGGDLTWGEFLSTLYQGGKFKLTADFSDEISKDESDRDKKAALNIVHYTEEAGMYPYYDNIGPVLIEKDTEIDLNGHTISRAFPKEGEYHSAGMVIWLRNGAKLTITDSAGGGKITGGYNKGTSGVNTWTVDGVTIQTRLCKTNGGGIYVENGDLYLLGGTICNNTCSYMEKDYAGGCGGGLYVEEGSVFIGEDACIANNTAFSKGNQTGLGGGLYASEGTSIIIEDEASVSGNKPSSAEHPEINIPAGVKEFTIHFVLESDETVKVLEDVIGEASIGSVIKSDDYPEHATGVNGHLVKRSQHTSMTVSESGDNELFIKYAYNTPTATVDDINAPEGVRVYDTETLEETKYVADVEKAVRFTADEVTEKQFNHYRNWICDYAISFDSDVDADSFGLWGKYDFNDAVLEASFVYPKALEEGEKVLLLTDKVFTSIEAPKYYELLNVIRSFECGAFNLDNDNISKTMKIELVMWPADGTPDDAVVIETYSYEFAEKKALREFPPAFPTATLTWIAPLEDVVLTDIATRQSTDYYVDIANAAKFDADDVSDEQFEYYKNWNCDLAVTFDSAIDAESFGLWGKYDNGQVVYDVAFVYPEAVTEGQKVLLLTNLLGEEGLCTYDFVKNTVGSLSCGAFNLDESNKGKTMKVQLIMWPENGSVDEAQVIKEFDYNFDDLTKLTKIAPELPTATVTSIEAPQDVALTDVVTRQTTDNFVNIGQAARFEADDVSEEQFDYYKNWNCDFAVTFDSAIDAGSFGLWGAYDNGNVVYDVAFVYPNALTAGEKVLLLTTLLDEEGLCTYDFVKNIVGTFDCGAFNLDESNKGKTMKVQLIMWPEDGSVDDAVVIEEFEYKFGDLTEIVPALPTASFEEIEAPQNVEVYDMSYELTGQLTDVEYAGKFTADEVTEDKFNYYQNWLCDFVVSFDSSMDGGSFGLYGAYGELERTFVFPNELSADEKVYLLRALGDSGFCTYDNIYNVVKEFSCGIFNLSEDNVGKTIKVELIMYPSEDVIDEAVVIQSFEYEIGFVTELRDIVPEPPTATVYGGIGAQLVPIADSLSVVADIPCLFSYTADMPSEEQYEYYKDWRCDFIISFSDDVAANSIGLYGEYGDYCLVIIPNVDFVADTDFLMMEHGLFNPCDYKEILNDVQQFLCGAFNLEEANYGTDMTVRLVIWDGSAEIPEYIDLCEPVTYTFGEPAELLGPYTVELSSKDEKGNTGLATLVGGGDNYVFKASVTISAPEVTNYRFVGWYDGEDCVSVLPEYTFNIQNDVSYVAVYECLIETAALHVIGEHYTVNDSVEQVANGDFEVSVGESVTVKYVGEDFLYWTNESDNIVSTSAEYSFVFVCETKIKLVTKTNTQNSVRIVVLNSYSQVLQTGNFDDEYDIADFLDGIAPTKMGATFAKWVFKGTKTEATPQAILALAETDTPFCELVPTYTATQDAGEFTLTVNVLNGTELLTDDALTGVSYAAGKNVRIQLSDLIEAFGLTDADKFNYWSLDGGKTVVSNQDSYLIVSIGGAEIELTAVFNSEEEFDVDANIVITQMFATKSGDNYILSTSLSYFIPEGCTIREVGFVFSADNRYSGNLDELKLGAENTRKSISSLALNSGVYTFNASAGPNPSKTLYIRAYMIYTDTEGNVVTMYSDNAKAENYYSLIGLQ
ncbi:MAG: hypothetical protein J5643_09910 [Lachnospiraceae bacterium]|nr:hypothetical protein [Lachnospiraceae bacterium]